MYSFDPLVISLPRACGKTIELARMARAYQEHLIPVLVVTKDGRSAQSMRRTLHHLQVNPQLPPATVIGIESLSEDHRKLRGYSELAVFADDVDLYPDGVWTLRELAFWESRRLELVAVTATPSWSEPLNLFETILDQRMRRGKNVRPL